jgi:hypothetical protein
MKTARRSQKYKQTSEVTRLERKLKPKRKVSLKFKLIFAATTLGGA